MVAPLKFTGPLHRQQVSGIGHDADQTVAAFWIAADLAFRLGGEMKAGLALANLRAGRQESIGELTDLLFRLIEQMQSQTLGGTGAATGNRSN